MATVQAQRLLPVGRDPNPAGARTSPFALVIFLDYDCPPCRRVDSDLPGMLARHPGDVRVVVRHCPLTMLHPHARAAAVAAEAAGLQGRFWEAHRWLMRSACTEHDASMSRLAVALRLDRDQFGKDMRRLARQRVDSDVALARRLRVRGTPTLYLCFPDGRARHILHVWDVDEAVERRTISGAPSGRWGGAAPTCTPA